MKSYKTFLNDLANGSEYYKKGYKEAIENGWRAAPQNLKALSKEMKDWYAGFDDAMKNDRHPTLDSKGSSRGNGTPKRTKDQ